MSLTQDVKLTGAAFLMVLDTPKETISTLASKAIQYQTNRRMASFLHHFK